MLSEKPWQGRRAVFYVLALVTALFWVFMVMGLLQNMHAVNLSKEDTLGNLMLATLSFHGTALLVTAAFLWWQHISWSDAFGFSKASARRALITGLVSAVVLFPVGFGLRALCVWLVYGVEAKAPEQDAVQMLENLQSPALLVYFILFSTVIAPVAEEIVFRGVFYPAVKQQGFPKLALWGTAIFFGLIHWNLPAFLPLVLLGVALAVLYEWTNNLLTNIAAHSIFNAFNLVLFFAQPHQPPH